MSNSRTELVVLRRVAGRDHDPAPREGPWRPKSLVLQELEHHGGQRLADAVDLVQEEDALLQPGPSIVSYTEAMISLMVYSVTGDSLPP